MGKNKGRVEKDNKNVAEAPDTSTKKGEGFKALHTYTATKERERLTTILAEKMERPP